MRQDYESLSNRLQNAVNLPDIQRSIEKRTNSPVEQDRRNLGQKNAWEQFCDLNNLYPRCRNISVDTLAIPDDEGGSFADRIHKLLRKPSSIILTGLPGRGKTLFMFALIRAMFERNMMRLGDIRYFPSLEFDRCLQEEYQRYKSTRHFIESLSSVPILAIDDLGIDVGTQRFEREFYEIVDKRFGRELLTFFTTNLKNEAEITAHYGARIGSRLKEVVYIEFTGPDLRGKRI